MGVIRTDTWLEKWIDKPVELCRKAEPEKEEIAHFYQYLQSFGMYQPSRISRKIFEDLKENKAWETIEKIYLKYKKLWDGPAVQIYIFPINANNRRLMMQTKGKSGVTFRKKIYLFLSSSENDKQWESLFVHEYNHAARMDLFQKDLQEYSLLDSMIFEGLAEHAVEEYCGEEFLAVWSKGYSEKQLKHYWHSDFKERLNIKKKTQMHDDLLFGKKFVPNMMGYSIGYRIISEYKKNHILNTKKGLSIPSKNLLIENFLN